MHEREAAHKLRFLTEVDLARQGVNALESDLAKEKKRRTQLEEGTDTERQAYRAALDEARRTERNLREDLQRQAVALARAEAASHGLEQQVSAMREQLADAKGAHDAATALAHAIAAVGQGAAKRSSRRGSRTA
jgi:predicted  nucleic acid-binding Zn-ribbon protein